MNYTKNEIAGPTFSDTAQLFFAEVGTLFKFLKQPYRVHAFSSGFRRSASFNMTMQFGLPGKSHVVVCHLGLFFCSFLSVK